MKSKITKNNVKWMWIKTLIRNPKMFKWYMHWKYYNNDVQNPLNEGLPWINYSVIDWLNRYLKPDMKIFEWGSGGSTVFFSNKVKSVVTVENDLEWYKIVSTVIRERSLDNVEIFLRIPIKVDDKNNPFKSSLSCYSDLSFENYVRIIEDYPDDYFDLIMVDGRARIACIQWAIKKTKPGCILLLDNSEREEYITANNILRKWKKRIIGGPVFHNRSNISKCSIWKKPVN